MVFCFRDLQASPKVEPKSDLSDQKVAKETLGPNEGKLMNMLGHPVLCIFRLNRIITEPFQKLHAENKGI